MGAIGWLPSITPRVRRNFDEAISVVFSGGTFTTVVLGAISVLAAADKDTAAKKDPDAKIKAAMAKLSESDRKLAEARAAMCP